MDGERLIVSTASEAAIEQGNVVQCGPRWRALIGAVQTLERACGTLDRSPGHDPGGFAGQFARQFRCGQFVSCRGV